MTAAIEDPEIRDAVARAERHLLYAGAPVSAWSIQAWCGAMGDINPVYLDDEAAARAGFGGVIAPPLMMHGYTLPTLLKPEVDSPTRRLRRRFADYGFTSVVAATYEQAYVSPVRIGDMLKREVLISAVSDEKQTALGPGHFVTTTHRVTNQAEELIGTLLIRVMYFNPRGQVAEKRPAPATAADASPGADESSETVIPPLEIPVTTSLIITTALATNDFELVHHDRDYAQREGLPDIIMNILTSAGLATRYVTDWGGPETILKKLSIRLMAQNCPGDSLVIQGVARPGEDEDTVIRVSETNARGRHADAVLTVALR